MFINFSNHPSQIWSREQTDAARGYGAIVDVSFPAVPPDASEEEIQGMAEQSCVQIASVIEGVNGGETSAVHIMGEMTLTYAIVNRLLKRGVCCMASTTTREVTTDTDGNKISVFRFVRFRQYA